MKYEIKDASSSKIKIGAEITAEEFNNFYNNIQKKYIDNNLALIRTLINENIKYPSKARKLSIEGIVVVKFKISENGSVEDIVVLEGHRFLQNATIEAIEEASKKFPKTNKSIEIQIPIVYKLI